MENGQQRIQIRYLTKDQLEHILLTEIKKWEPYIEEEKNQLKLNFVEDEELKIEQPGGDIKTFIANLEIVETLDDDGEPIEIPPAITN